jgi:hypothetical protein
MATFTTFFPHPLLLGVLSIFKDAFLFIVHEEKEFKTVASTEGKLTYSLKTSS